MSNIRGRVGVGIIGCGNVGAALIEAFWSRTELINHESGAYVVLSAVCNRSSNRMKKVLKECGGNAFPGIKQYTKYQNLINDPAVDIVVELIGGDAVAYNVITSALKKGKHVVTANKAVMAGRWSDIFELAQQMEKMVYFEAAVMAGVSVCQIINEGLRGNNISEFYGIVNGTTNFILTRMMESGSSLENALKDAQHLGYAESDSTSDIEGYDSMYKLRILSSIISGTHISDIHVQRWGIKYVSAQDISFAQYWGYVIKLLVRAKFDMMCNTFEVRPFFVPKSHMLANVKEVSNALFVKGDLSGPVMFLGDGAGGKAAASGVISDIICQARHIAAGTAGKSPYILFEPETRMQITSIGQIQGQFHISLEVLDDAGSLQTVARVLAEHGISVGRMNQIPGGDEGTENAVISIITHSVVERELVAAILELNDTEVVLGKSAHYFKIFN